MHRAEHGGEADVADAAEDDVERHVDLGVLAAELLRRDVDAAAGGDDDADGLVDDVDALEDVDGGVVVGGGDAEDVDGVDEAVHHAVPALHADDHLAAGGGERVVTDGFDGGVGGVGVGVGVLGGGEGEAGLAEGGEGDEGSGWGEPLAGLEEDVGPIGGLKRERQARHGFALLGGFGLWDLADLTGSVGFLERRLSHGGSRCTDRVVSDEEMDFRLLRKLKDR